MGQVEVSFGPNLIVTTRRAKEAGKCNLAVWPGRGEDRYREALAGSATKVKQ